jgi:CubicO group peptidase (beta-lactamase class C family)
MTKISANKAVRSNLNLLTAWIEAQVAQREQPGLSIGIVYDQNLVWAKGFGYADLAAKTPATPGTIYRIASITKLFTSTAIVQLRDAGKVQLDDPLSKHLPWFQIQQRYPAAPPITLRHLMTHTSGLPREAAFAYWSNNQFPSMAEVQATLPQQSTALPTETKWKYSNLALALLGEVVAAVADMPYADYIQRKILTPLEMTSTFVTTVPADHPQLATGYGRRLPGQTRAIGPHIDCNGITPAANLASTVEDLARFAMLQLRDGPQGGRQILSGSSLREMQRVHWLNPDWQSGWGLGFELARLHGKTLVGHGGSLQGYRTQFQLCPTDKVAVIVLTNADDGNPMSYAEKAFQWVTPALVKAAQPKAKTAPASADWQRYVGKYRNTWGDDEVMILHDELVVVDPLAPDPLATLSKLIPVDTHTFRIESKENFGSDGELAVFQVDSQGKVEWLKMGNTYTYPQAEW